MADSSGISWTDATFNGWIGCTKVSPGCDNCYAAQQDSFRKWTPEGWGAGMPRKHTSAQNWNGPVKWNAREFVQCAACGWRGELDAFMRQEAGAKQSNCPSCQRDAYIGARRRVFCSSLADVFDSEVDPLWRLELFNLIERTPALDWMLLTKRIGNAKFMLPQRWLHNPLPNVWLGATIVNQEEADRDIVKLLDTPAAIHFLSMEPLLGPVNLRCCTYREPGVPLDEERIKHSLDALTGVAGFQPKRPALDWVIVGGESGPHARPMHPAWAQSLRDQCVAAGVPFHFKQWGEWAVDDARHQPAERVHWWTTGPTHYSMVRVGKKAAGRLLDGQLWHQFPQSKGDTP